jgi:hypothetical protein
MGLENLNGWKLFIAINIKKIKKLFLKQIDVESSTSYLGHKNISVDKRDLL